MSKELTTTRSIPSVVAYVVLAAFIVFLLQVIGGPPTNNPFTICEQIQGGSWNPLTGICTPPGA